MGNVINGDLIHRCLDAIHVPSGHSIHKRVEAVFEALRENPRWPRGYVPVRWTDGKYRAVVLKDGLGEERPYLATYIIYRIERHEDGSHDVYIVDCSFGEPFDT